MPVYRFLLPHGQHPELSVSDPDGVASGASYPGCCRNRLPEVAMPGGACKAIRFGSVQEGKDYAEAHGEIAVLVTSEEQAWQIAELAELGCEPDLPEQPTIEAKPVPGPGEEFQYPPGAMTPGTGGVCEPGWTAVQAVPGRHDAYCMPPKVQAPVTNGVPVNGGIQLPPVYAPPTIITVPNGGGGGPTIISQPGAPTAPAEEDNTVLLALVAGVILLSMR